MVAEANQIKPAKKIEFIGCEYKFIQRYRHNLCLYSSGGSFIVVEFNPESGHGHQYFVVGVTHIGDQHWGYDGMETTLDPNNTKYSTGYATPVKM